MGLNRTQWYSIVILKRCQGTPCSLETRGVYPLRQTPLILCCVMTELE